MYIIQSIVLYHELVLPKRWMFMCVSLGARIDPLYIKCCTCMMSSETDTVLRRQVDLGPVQAREEKTEQNGLRGSIFKAGRVQTPALHRRRRWDLLSWTLKPRLSLFGKSALNPRLFFHCEDSASHEETFSQRAHRRYGPSIYLYALPCDR